MRKQFDERHEHFVQSRDPQKTWEDAARALAPDSIPAEQLLAALDEAMTRFDRVPRIKRARGDGEHMDRRHLERCALDTLVPDDETTLARFPNGMATDAVLALSDQDQCVLAVRLAERLAAAMKRQIDSFAKGGRRGALYYLEARGVALGCLLGRMLEGKLPFTESQLAALAHASAGSAEERWWGHHIGGFVKAIEFGADRSRSGRSRRLAPLLRRPPDQATLQAGPPRGLPPHRRRAQHRNLLQPLRRSHPPPAPVPRPLRRPQLEEQAAPHGGRRVPARDPRPARVGPPRRVLDRGTVSINFCAARRCTTGASRAARYYNALDHPPGLFHKRIMMSEAAFNDTSNVRLHPSPLRQYDTRRHTYGFDSTRRRCPDRCCH
jgi:hypothetical protein